MSITYTPTLQPATASAEAAMRPGSATGDSRYRSEGSVWLTPTVLPDNRGPPHVECLAEAGARGRQSRVVSASMATVIARMSGASSPATTSTP
jgi:hypothetical protein